MKRANSFIKLFEIYLAIYSSNYLIVYLDISQSLFGDNPFPISIRTFSANDIGFFQLIK